MGKNLFDKVWELHTVAELETGQTQLFVGMHYIHEVTSPQAFCAIDEQGVPVLYPDRTFATADHVVPTDCSARPFADPLAEEMISRLEKNTEAHGIRYCGLGSDGNGIVHITGPELGLTQPGMTVTCGDSHTSTHGAFGAVAFGIGTSQVSDVLAAQSLALNKPKVRKITVEGVLRKGVTAKDVSLYIISRLGVKAGAGYAYEYGGSMVSALTMEERMTLCNMSIEGGARFGYINPDSVTAAFLAGRKYAPSDMEMAEKFWGSLRSGTDAEYDNEVTFYAGEIEPMVTWGINPGQAVPVSGTVPVPGELAEEERENAVRAYEYMKVEPGRKMTGFPVDVVFIGSCTNGRISDLRRAAEIFRGRIVAPGVKALIVPGSQAVKRQAVEEGLDRIFTEAGCEFREPGCSMCLAMNPDRLQGDQVCASTSNRNYMGRQGSSTGRTILLSPAMAAAAAIKGEITDVRKFMD